MRTALVLAAMCASPAAAEEVWRWRAGTRVEASGRVPVREGGRDLGGLGVRVMEHSVRRRVAAGKRVYLLAGAAFEDVSLSRPPGAPLPDRLQAAAAQLGAEWLIDGRSWAFLDAAPGLYGAERLEGRAFNAPASVQYNRLLRPGLRALAGLSLDPFRKARLLPFGGAAWRLGPRWNLRLTLPEPRAERRLLWDERQVVDLFAGLSLSGGQYRAARDLGTRRGRREVDGQTLSYTATRALAGARWMRGGLEAELSAGWAFARRFRYEPSGVELESDGAPFAALAVSARL